MERSDKETMVDSDVVSGLAYYPFPLMSSMLQAYKNWKAWVSKCCLGSSAKWLGSFLGYCIIYRQFSLYRGYNNRLVGCIRSRHLCIIGFEVDKKKLPFCYTPSKKEECSLVYAYLLNTGQFKQWCKFLKRGLCFFPNARNLFSRLLLETNHS